MRPTVAASLDHAKSRGAHGRKADGFRRRADDDSTPPERLASRLLVVALLPWLLLLLQHFFRLSFKFVLELLRDPASSGGEHRAGGKRRKRRVEKRKKGEFRREEGRRFDGEECFFPSIEKKKKKNENGRTSKNHSLRLSLSFLFQLLTRFHFSLSPPLACEAGGHGGEKEAPDEIRVRLSSESLVALGKKALNAVAGDDRRNRLRDGRRATTAAATATLASTPRMLLLPFAVRSCRPLLEEPT